MPSSLVIAIDGPVASGKTVVGRTVADRFVLRFLDTGAMYRAVTHAALEAGVRPDDEKGLVLLATTMTMRPEAGERLVANGRDVTDMLRTPRVEQAVSLVSSVPGVRSALVAQQREIAREGGIVMVGRDIGTVVLPEAPLKVFLTASVAVRAHRRYTEAETRGVDRKYIEIEAELRRRDSIDSHRSESPLRAAEDAIIIETDEMDVGDVVDKIASYVGSSASEGPASA